MALIVENEVLFGQCNGCGHQTQMSQNHKLSKYLIKNPPRFLRDIKQAAGAPVQAQDQEQELPVHFLKYEARQVLQEEPLASPYDETTIGSLDKIFQAYFKKFLVIESDYSYEDSDTENLYKLIKRLRLPKSQYCLVGWIIFQYIFDQNIFKQVEQ